MSYPLIYMDSGLGLNSTLQACETGILSTDPSHQPLPPPGILIRWLLYSPSFGWLVLTIKKPTSLLYILEQSTALGTDSLFSNDAFLPPPR